CVTRLDECEDVDRVANSRLLGRLRRRSTRIEHISRHTTDRAGQTRLRPGTVRREGVRYGFFFQAEDGIRDWSVTGVQTCALPICLASNERVRRISIRRFRARPCGFALLAIGWNGPYLAATMRPERTFACSDRNRTTVDRKSVV